MSVVPAEPVESPEPAWRQRAVERSTRAAKLRAEQRVQRFLDAAQELIADKGTTDFTVQEVVERSRQSLRSFYQHFDGKHELLLALFEDALSRSATEMRERLSTVTGPLDRLKVAVDLLYDSSTPREGQQSPLFTDFAIQLLVSHPDQVATAHLPLLALFTELVEDAVKAGQAVTPRPRRTASLIMQTAMFTAQAPRRSGRGAAFPDRRGGRLGVLPGRHHRGGTGDRRGVRHPEGRRSQEGGDEEDHHQKVRRPQGRHAHQGLTPPVVPTEGPAPVRAPRLVPH
ncbi:TetR/AcrR family transcriptional regulator [Streptomyces mutabilis]|uniref:TetR/AcrR family transcriptional regulator n=1 Tax=Streptomyces mutabilis TaxID=67332 RepID=UPI0035E7B093